MGFNSGFKGLNKKTQGSIYPHHSSLQLLRVHIQSRHSLHTSLLATIFISDERFGLIETSHRRLAGKKHNSSSLLRRYPQQLRDFPPRSQYILRPSLFTPWGRVVTIIGRKLKIKTVEPAAEASCSY